MIRWPWQRWNKPVDLPPNDIEASEEAKREVALRKQRVAQALEVRHAVIVHNHIAHDIRRALERH